MIDFDDPKYRLAERVKRAMDRHGLTIEEATADVKSVIECKEQPTNTVQECTRQRPHVCRLNGPCNGWPRKDEE